MGLITYRPHGWRGEAGGSEGSGYAAAELRVTGVTGRETDGRRQGAWKVKNEIEMEDSSGPPSCLSSFALVKYSN